MHPVISEIQKGNLKKVPEVRTGYTVRVSQKVTEGSKERIQKFEGLVIKVSHGEGVEKNFTVRKIVQGIGVEKIFPFHSPNITDIRVIKKAKLRRQKLYYMRERFGKSARLSEKHVTDEERAAEEERLNALYAEAVKAEEKRKAAEEAAKAPEEAPAEETTAETPAAPAEEAAAETPAETPAPEAPAEEAEAPAEEEKPEAPVAPEAPAETEAPAEEGKPEAPADIPQTDQESTGEATEDSANDEPTEQAVDAPPEAEDSTEEKS